MKGGRRQGGLTCGKALNNSSACPVLRVLVIFPIEISVLPEVVDEMFGALEGTDRLPPADKLRQLGVANQCTND